MQQGQTLNGFVSVKIPQTKIDQNKSHSLQAKPAKKTGSHSFKISVRVNDWTGLVLSITALGLLTAWAIDAMAKMLFCLSF